MKKQQKAKAKRLPLLADEFLNLLPADMPKPMAKRMTMMQNRLRSAKVFVLDRTAAEYAAHFIRDYPEAIAADQEFAIPSFDRMYVEVPFDAFFTALGSPSGMPESDADTEVGYLFDGPDVFVLSRARNKVGRQRLPLCLPITYHRNRPFTAKAEQDMCEMIGTSRIGIDGLFWGASLMKFYETDHPAARSLRANHSFEWWPEIASAFRPGEMDHLAKVSAGDLRNIIAITIFLNRTREVRIDDEVPPAQGFIGNKQKPYTKHNVVRLKLDPKPLLARVYGHTGSKKRLHDCRGHFCHDKVARASGHHLGALPGTQKHTPDWREYGVNEWRCLVCGGKRWHRREHKRGTKDVGKIVKHYEVTK